MTSQFVAFWKKAHGCTACIAIPGKGMCSGCKVQALVRWHSYVATRHQKGLCLHCPRKRKKYEQRCGPCAELNRQRCVDYYHRVLKHERQALVDKGVCPRCERRPAGEGHFYCGKCRGHMNALARGFIKPTKKPYKFLSLAN
jgi:hypothetical protein